MSDLIDRCFVFLGILTSMVIGLYWLVATDCRGINKDRTCHYVTVFNLDFIIADTHRREP